MTRYRVEVKTETYHLRVEGTPDAVYENGEVWFESNFFDPCDRGTTITELAPEEPKNPGAVVRFTATYGGSLTAIRARDTSWYDSDGDQYSWISLINLATEGSIRIIDEGVPLK